MNRRDDDKEYQEFAKSEYWNKGEGTWHRVYSHPNGGQFVVQIKQLDTNSFHSIVGDHYCASGNGYRSLDGAKKGAWDYILKVLPEVQASLDTFREARQQIDPE